METVAKKEATRRKIEEIKNSSGDGELLRRSGAVTARVAALPEYARARAVMIYVSKKGEVHTHRLIRAALEAGKKVTAPMAVPATRGLVLGLIEDFDADLHPGRYGVLEPVRIGIDPATIDMFIVPGIAFDHAGTRLGSGWGYFDNMLTHLGPRQAKVGLAFDFQMVRNLEKEAHDVAVDIILLETRTVRVRSERRQQ